MTESHTHEYKQIWKDDFLKVLCAFANAEGGTLEIGRKDDGTALGVPNAPKLLEDLPNKIRDILGIVVDIKLDRCQEVDLILIYTEPHPNPISYKGEYYYRSGSTVQALKGGDLERFLLRKRGRHWDGIPLPGFNPVDCDPAAFDQFRRRALQSGRMDDAVLNDADETLLEKLQLVEGDYLRQAGALLFARDPDRFIVGAYVKIGFFVTDDDLRYQDEIHGNLFEQIDKTMDLLTTKYMKAYIRYEGLQRIEEFPFPVAALREALLNALAHKDYGTAIPVQISVYEDRIVIWNPGVLPENWTVQSLLEKHPSRPFNPLVSGALFRAGFIESWGRGIEKIDAECRNHGIEPPDYNYGMAGLMLTFNAKLPDEENSAVSADEKEGGQIGGQIGGAMGGPMGGLMGGPIELTARQNELLELLREEPLSSRECMATKLGINQSAIQKHLKILKEKGVLKRVGGTRGHWEVLK